MLACCVPGQRRNLRLKKCQKKINLPTHLISARLTFWGTVAIERILWGSLHNQTSAIALVETLASVANDILGGDKVFRTQKLPQHGVSILLKAGHPDVAEIDAVLWFRPWSGSVWHVDPLGDRGASIYEVKKLSHSRTMTGNGRHTVYED